MARQRLATVVVATLATATIALPAFAHASFDKAQVPADTEIDLTFRAPQERASTNARIEALAPRQFTILDCTAPANWTCEVDTTSEAPATVIRWVAGPSAVLPEMNFAMFVRTPGEDQQGVYAWPVIQTYADGFEAEWIGEDAPRVQVGDKEAEVVDNPEPENNHSEPAASEPATAEPEPAASASSTTDADQPDQDSSEAGAQDGDETPGAQPSSLPVSGGTSDDGADDDTSPTTGGADGDDGAVVTAETATTTDGADEDGGAPLGLAIGILAALGLAGGALALRNRAAA